MDRKSIQVNNKIHLLLAKKRLELISKKHRNITLGEVIEFSLKK